MAGLRGYILAFHQIQLSMEHRPSVSINAPGWGLVNLSQLAYTSPAETRLLLSRKERWIFNNSKVILTILT